jgi:hypothetical protein
MRYIPRQSHYRFYHPKNVGRGVHNNTRTLLTV